MRALFIAISCAVGAISAANATERATETYYFACKSIADLAAITRAVKNNDDVAFSAISERVFPTSQCKLLVPRQRLAVEQTNDKGQHCVRAESDSACFWTDEAAFHPDLEAEEWRRRRDKK